MHLVARLFSALKLSDKHLKSICYLTGTVQRDEHRGGMFALFCSCNESSCSILNQLEAIKGALIDTSVWWIIVVKMKICKTFDKKTIEGNDLIFLIVLKWKKTCLT